MPGTEGNVNLLSNGGPEGLPGWLSKDELPTSLRAKEHIPLQEKQWGYSLCLQLFVDLSNDRWKSITRRLLFIPFGLASAVILTGLLTLIFAVEIYLDEIYDGPFKYYLVHSTSGPLTYWRYSRPPFYSHFFSRFFPKSTRIFRNL